MNPVWWTAALSALSAALVTAALGERAGGEVWLGMAAPLSVTAATTAFMTRVYREHPERMTGLMMTAFAGKLLLFGAYVALVVGAMGVRPVPFVASFVGYFIALHAAEAFCLHRLFAEKTRTA